MDNEMKTQWAASMEGLTKMSPEKRKHFGMLLISLAECYTDEEASAVVLIHKDDHLSMFSAGATEFECVEILSKASELVSEFVTADAPPKEMFN